MRSSVESSADVAPASKSKSKSASSGSEVVTAELLHSLLADANQRQTNLNLMVCCVVLFGAEASRGLFIPSLWSCVQNIGMDRSFLSWCIPLFSVGRMFGSYLAGRACDKWNDDGLPTLACMLASIAGGAAYIMADMNKSWIILLLAEFVMGLGGGTLAVLRAHVSKITTDRQRMSHTTAISTAQFVGLGLMPLAALAINYAFVGPHRDAHAGHIEIDSRILVSAATGMIGEALALAGTTGAHVDPQQATIGARYRNGGARARSARSGRQLLSSVSEATAGGSVAAAGALVGPALSPSVIGAESSTFLSRFFNHRTAPALLLIALNLGCMLLYFVFFEAGHTSLEYQAKKRSEAAKKRVTDALSKARLAGNEFDVDNEAEGDGGAFAQAPALGPGGSINAEGADDAVVSSSSGAGKKKKEVIFDLSKFDGLNLGGGGDASSGASSSSSGAGAAGGAGPAVSIVQVSDTTVIVLKPFEDSSSSSSSAATAAAAASGGEAARPARSSKVADSASGADLEMDSRRNSIGGLPGSVPASSASSWLSSAASVASAIVQLFKSDGKAAGGGAGSKGAAAPSMPTLPSSGAGSGGFDGGQARRIAAYESGRLGSGDLDSEGVLLGPLRLTPERMVLWGSCLFVYLNYTIRGVLATVETIGTPTLARYQGIPPGPLEVEASARFFGYLGLLGCVVFFFQWYLQDWIDEPSTLIAGFAVTVLGSGTILYWDDEQAFVFGCVCIWSFGLPAVQNSVLAALSRILGTRPQGTWMGWIQTFGSLGRVTFPIITKVFGIPFAFFLSTLMCGVAIVALIIYIKLVKMTM